MPAAFSFIRILPEMPIDAPTFFRIGIRPRYGTLITCIHAGPAFDAVFELKDNLSIVVVLVAFRRTNVRRAVVRAHRIANIGLDENMRPGIGAPLISVGDEAQAL